MGDRFKTESVIGMGQNMHVVVIINLIGCTTVQTIEVPPDKLHEQIRHESLLKVGDNVRIITENKKEYQLIVTAINEDEIRGEDATIPIYTNNEDEIRGEDVAISIDSIEAVETRDFNAGKTALLGGGIYVTLSLMTLVLLSGVAFMP